MNYSTLGLELERDVDGVLFDVQSLYSWFLQLTDRRRSRGIRYQLALILVATVLAKKVRQ